MWRTGKAMMEQRWMDERCYVTEGEVVSMNYYFIDENLNGIHAWTQKHNNYANREIVAAYEGYWNDSVSGGNGLESRNKEKESIINYPNSCARSSISSFATSALVVFLMASPVLFGLHCRHIGTGIL